MDGDDLSASPRQAVCPELSVYQRINSHKNPVGKGDEHPHFTEAPRVLAMCPRPQF